MSFFTIITGAAQTALHAGAVTLQFLISAWYVSVPVLGGLILLIIKHSVHLSKEEGL